MPPYRRTLCALWLLASGSAHAAQLGQLSTASYLGETLDARVELYGADARATQALRFEVRPDMARIDAPDVADFTAVVAYDSAGNPYVSLRSTRPVTTQTLSFRLRLLDDDGSLVRHYAATLTAAPAVQTAFRPAAARRRAAQSVRVATPATATVVGSGSYGPVRPGQSLWQILREQGLAGGDVEARMAEVVAANPQAFVAGDANRLIAGALLDLGAGSATVAATPAATASATAGAEHIEPVAVHIAPVTVPADAPAVAPAAAAPAAAATAPAPDIAARLAALETKFAEIRARYAAQQTGQAAPAATAAVTDSVATVVDASSAAAATPAAAPAVSNAAADTAKAAPRANAAAASEQPSPPRADNPPISVAAAGPLPGLLLPGAGLLGALLITAAGTQFARRRRRHASASAHKDAELDRVAEITAKAEKRLALEDEVKRTFRTKLKLAETPHAAAVPVTGDDGRDDGRSGFEEIETRIAYGQYAEAEELLAEVLDRAPNNHRAKLRLAEVYYLDGQRDAFVTLSEEIARRHRGEITDDDWARVVRMGRIIAPESVLFSGPTPIETLQRVS